MSDDDLTLLCHAEIPGLPPSVNHIWMNGKGRTFKPKAVAMWQQGAIIVLRCGRKVAEPTEHKCFLKISLHISNHRRMDIDNRIKCLQDCLTPAGVMFDDSQIYRLEVERHQANNDHVVVDVWTFKDTCLKPSRTGQNGKKKSKGDNYVSGRDVYD